ncbi:galactan beta-1,4-galactosyltransferase GALS1 [Spinacia oleracea]|uniref:Glycosyltransferase family 92 protein n=1 Tax=Spinacia oleracea TaxID=3562 RepID=A0A9R0K761_SPIOL|nr:galactan beta-1,4-galactosyltransferase GALS1 [Spinacia oleracea]
MKKQGSFTGGVTGKPVGKLLLCFETKPVLATLLTLTLVLLVWNLQPYYDHLLSLSSYSCHCSNPPLSTAKTTTTNHLLNTTATGKTTALLSLSATTTEKPKTTTTNDLLNTTTATTAKTTALLSLSAVNEPRKLPPRDPNKREFKPYGNAAALFVQMGAYRGGPATFSVVGLASKPIHVYGQPWYKCEWVPNNATQPPTRAKAFKILPDWGYGRVYTVVVVNCTFPTNPNADNSGGKLNLYAYYSPSPRFFEKFTVLEESIGTYNNALYTSAPALDYLYCGSSLYGNISAARIREWVAYHAWLFGEKSHFVFHDAGGVTDDVRKVLEPWVKKGRVTIQDIREQENFDGYYYNQFLVVNDCLHRYRFSAKWTFYFDVDEYMYVPQGSSLKSVMKEFDGFTQITIEQNPMSSALCFKNDSSQDYSREWGFEKLLFRDWRTKIRRDRKYAIQARNVLATGVHMSENIVGKSLHHTETKIRYYHYHNSIQVVGEPCRVFLPTSAKKKIQIHERLPYVYDENMKKLADTIKRFEHETLGSSQLPL